MLTYFIVFQNDIYNFKTWLIKATTVQYSSVIIVLQYTYIKTRQKQLISRYNTRMLLQSYLIIY